MAIAAFVPIGPLALGNGWRRGGVTNMPAPHDPSRTPAEKGGGAIAGAGAGPGAEAGRSLCAKSDPSLTGSRRGVVASPILTRARGA